ncbi:hypothetical protein [Desulfopila sp. IMCC35008]|uniref:hypothetical protein n=1 Tax=Desulfopila sp. IMCC35008 TaxID=2653858 RepID=UPI0013D73C61|nr:hypothetical protein [Desulfopila sp. IMCC35008]
MLQNLSRFKPGGHRKTHLLLAASLWTGIGCLLTARGLHWLAKSDSFAVLVPAVLAGVLKSRYILDKTAAKSIDRILHLKDGTCLGAVYSTKTWGLVLLMMGMGIILRMSSCPLPVLGFLYVMIGCALIRSSRLGWHARNT